jgi:SAM-dependent methyltransferase
MKFTTAMYKEWHEIYVRSTNEKDLVEEKIKALVLPALKNKGGFLDVGAGDGDLTFRFIRDFKHTTAVEPIAEVRKEFERKGVEFVNANFQDAPLERRYDFILCSHVFWLVERADQMAFMQKMHSLLNPGGKMAIIMVSPVGQSYDFYKRFFYNYDTTTHDIIGDLHRMDLPCSVIPVKFHFGSKAFDDFFNVCKLFTVESWLHPNKKSSQTMLKKDNVDIEKYTDQKLKEIESFIRENCVKPDGGFEMLEETDIIVVTKE